MRASVGGYIFPQERVPQKRVALVFGASVRPDGSLSPFLQDRVNAAITLYKRGTVAKILMTGDNGSPDYNEVAAMEKAALEAGVPQADIRLDHAGFSTYESCYRARQIFGVDNAVLVTQQYHLYRALYTCRKAGIDAVGVAIEDFSKYPDTRLPYTIREFLATFKAWWEVEVQQPEPTFLGKYEGPL